MDKVINSYESLFIVKATLSDDAIAATVDKFTALIADNTTLIDVAKWGRRRLAYPISEMNEGYYVVVTFKSEPAFPNELERLMNINESIIRSLTVKLDFDASKRVKNAVPAAETTPAADDADAEVPAAPAPAAAPAAEPAAAPATAPAAEPAATPATAPATETAPAKAE
jgi:small subunit ribosomal protein S6